MTGELKRLQPLAWPDWKHLLAANANGAPVRYVGNGQLFVLWLSVTAFGFIAWKWRYNRGTAQLTFISFQRQQSLAEWDVQGESR